MTRLTLLLFSMFLAVARTVDAAVLWIFRRKLVLGTQRLTAWKEGLYEIHIEGEPLQVMFVNSAEDAAIFDELVRLNKKRLAPYGKTAKIIRA